VVEPSNVEARAEGAGLVREPVAAG